MTGGMKNMKKFIIYKAPRTGSTTLGEILTDTPGVHCVLEMLNYWDRVQSTQSYIDGILRQHGEACVGFTLNPRKPTVPLDFYDPGGPVTIFLLERENIFDQAVSVSVSRLVKKYPGNRQTEGVEMVLDYIEANDRIDPEVFRKACSDICRGIRKIADFARDYADLHGQTVIPLTYEGLYFGDHLERLEEALGITLQRAGAGPQHKVLPPAEEWLQNYAELRDLAASVTETRG